MEKDVRVGVAGAAGISKVPRRLRHLGRRRPIGDEACKPGRVDEAPGAPIDRNGLVERDQGLHRIGLPPLLTDPSV